MCTKCKTNLRVERGEGYDADVSDPTTDVHIGGPAAFVGIVVAIIVLWWRRPQS
jgi:hypothetical protein